MFKFFLASFLLFICFSTWLFGQSAIDLDKIKRDTQDSTNAYFYPGLVDEFVRSPENFSLDKGMHIYYGQLYSKGYKIFNLSEDRMLFDKFFNRENWNKALPYGEKLLGENPVDLEILRKMRFGYYQRGRKPEIVKSLKTRIDVLRNVILASGDGNTFESPFKLVAVSDEYAIMNIEGIEGINRQSNMLVNSVMDIWTVKKKGERKRKTMYFEVLRNMDAFRSLEK